MREGCLGFWALTEASAQGEGELTDLLLVEHVGTAGKALCEILGVEDPHGLLEWISVAMLDEPSGENDNRLHEVVTTRQFEQFLMKPTGLRLCLSDGVTFPARSGPVNVENVLIIVNDALSAPRLTQSFRLYGEYARWSDHDVIDIPRRPLKVVQDLVA